MNQVVYIIRITITTNMNSIIYTIVITIHLTCLHTRGIQAEILNTTTGPTQADSATNSTPDKMIDKTQDASTINASFNIKNISVTKEPFNTSGDVQSTKLKIKLTLDTLQDILNNTTGTHSTMSNETPASFDNHRQRRSISDGSVSRHSRRKRTTSGKTTRRKKYDYRRDPPPYLWTNDPKRETVRLWDRNISNPFSFKICKFELEEDIENYKRERAKPTIDFSKMVGPVPLRHPNGTRIKIKRKYSWMGDDLVSNETAFHRKCMRELEEYHIGNDSVSSDESETDSPTTELTRRMNLRTKAKYKDWTYLTPLPGVSWSPDVYVNSPHSDLFETSELGPAGSKTIEEYLHCSASKADYNDSIYDIPSGIVGGEPYPPRWNRPKYWAIGNMTPPPSIEFWNTDKSHYSDDE